MTTTRQILTEAISKIPSPSTVEGCSALPISAGSEPKFSQFEIAEYVCGWLLDGQALFTVEDAEMAIGNALGQLRCGQDGIEASIKSKAIRFHNELVADE